MDSKHHALVEMLLDGFKDVSRSKSLFPMLTRFDWLRACPKELNAGPRLSSLSA